MKFIAAVLLLVLVAGCETGIVVHDKDRAAELIVDCLSSFKSEEGRRLAYAWTEDRFKEDVSFVEFSKAILLIREKNRGADIRLAGYEVFGPTEILVVYAVSKLREGSLHFRFTLTGSRSRDYYLANLDTSGTAFAREGIYREFERSIVVKGV